MITKSREAVIRAANNVQMVLDAIKSPELSHYPEAEKQLWAMAALIQCDMCRAVMQIDESVPGLSRLLTMADLVSKTYEMKSWFSTVGNKGLMEIAAGRECGTAYVTERLRKINNQYPTSKLAKYAKYRHKLSFHYDKEMLEHLEEIGKEDSDEFYSILKQMYLFSHEWTILAREVILSRSVQLSRSS
jgi:hypothetical protein